MRHQKSVAEFDWANAALIAVGEIGIAQRGTG
jgi:hypothetical protein